MDKPIRKKVRCINTKTKRKKYFNVNTAKGRNFVNAGWVIDDPNFKMEQELFDMTPEEPQGTNQKRYNELQKEREKQKAENKKSMKIDTKDMPSKDVLITDLREAKVSFSALDKAEILYGKWLKLKNIEPVIKKEIEEPQEQAGLPEEPEIKVVEIESNDRESLKEYFTKNPNDGFYIRMSTQKMFELYKSLTDGNN